MTTPSKRAEALYEGLRKLKVMRMTIAAAVADIQPDVRISDKWVTRFLKMAIQRISETEETLSAITALPPSENKCDGDDLCICKKCCPALNEKPPAEKSAALGGV